MIKHYSKNTLKLINILFKISFSHKTIDAATKQYLGEISKGVSSFEQELTKFNYVKETAEFRYLKELFSTAVNFRSNKKLVKKVIENILNTPMIVMIILTPIFFPFFYFDKDLIIWNYIVIYFFSILVSLLIGVIIIRGTEFIKNFEVKVGKALTRMTQILYVSAIGAGIYFWIDQDEGVLKAIIFSVYSILYLIILFTVLKYVFAEVFVDAYYFSQKIQITDALIIESAYRLSKVDWSIAVKKKIIRQNTIIEIERLASLIENDWSNHILPGDEKTNKWKINTLIGIASSIRKLKRQIIIPSIETPTLLKDRFISIFEKVIKHDLQGLIDADVPATRIRKKSKLVVFQSVLVAVLPVSLAISMKMYAPDLISATYIHVAIIISGLWLLVCTLLWLDPNLADKIATVKSIRSVINNNEIE